ncbi:UDP-N-acetylmuramate--L-alanine ligase [Dyadobacter fanqingshengii]|uniref:UDP-N-acetylmuramate--L-alanine ligase n=1 Tax=Dyadobacter fanqingshengii TaxID=2906443 RepID=A0A9X1PD19_9BACT|nr:UDP-N-acetylmuramate--L-alanine ligase [Dyadobacter fanqingshengii]MCF0042302.1 UDP-N-acetylmuramate--L-alanine ligase [Dyadobacter fanqingshengii]USJ35170.1 UDP-N-acetylmuramate--L-alanine ligase [Dyadobacter fanqingshengii]
MTNWKYIYFVGIGGIGMSALARWFKANGFNVAGYDKTLTTLVQKLMDENISVTLEDETGTIPAEFTANPDETLVIYTPAVPVQHKQMIYFRDNNFLILKRSQVLGLLTKNLRTIGVAGTHGKTTTSSMVAHILRHAKVNSTAFLGGITQNYGTNLLLNEPTDNLEEVFCVVEADEFDRSFLTLFPEIAIVTSTDADHLDIYGKHEAVLESFRDYVSQIDDDGVLFMREGLELASSTKARVFTYSLNSGAYHSTNIHIKNARFVFDLIHPDGKIEGIAMKIPGYHNIENSIAASAVALYLGVESDKIKEALENYGGVKRRFEYQLEEDGHIYIDDYAHHPTEIEAFLSSVKGLYPGRHVTAIFQPHLFTRTRDFAEGFAESLSLADRLLLLEIYPARELPIEGVNSEMLMERITAKEKQLITKDKVLSVLADLNTDIVVTIGAGDIDTLVEPIRNLLKDSIVNN